MTRLASKKMLALLPLGIFAVALVTIVAAYQATFAAGVLDFYGGTVKTPPISMLMFAGPGRFYGQIGFPLVGILFGCIAPTFFMGLEQAILVAYNKSTSATTTTNNSTLSPHSFAIFLLKLSSFIAFICLAIVGLLPLQEDLEFVITRRGHHKITTQSIIHQVSAAVFFCFAILHMATWLVLMRSFQKATGQQSLFETTHSLSTRVSMWIKSTCLVLCFVPLPQAFLLHPISPVHGKLGLGKADRGGLMQYTLVACVAIFFASYSIELWRMADLVVAEDAHAATDESFQKQTKRRSEETKKSK